MKYSTGTNSHGLMSASVRPPRMKSRRNAPPAWAGGGDAGAAAAESRSVSVDKARCSPGVGPRPTSVPAGLVMTKWVHGGARELPNHPHRDVRPINRLKVLRR